MKAGTCSHTCSGLVYQVCPGVPQAGEQTGNRIVYRTVKLSDVYCNATFHACFGGSRCVGYSSWHTK